VYRIDTSALIVSSFAAALLAVDVVASGPSAGQTASTDAPRRAEPAMHLQVLLDRAAFSVGVIDGRPGRLTTLALEAFQASRGLATTGRPDEATLAALEPASHAGLAAYTITPEDVAGPLVDQIPEDFMEKGTLERLAYTSVAELLGERFHTTDRVLQRLNPSAAFAPGETIQVPNVAVVEFPATTGLRPEPGPLASSTDAVVVSKSKSTLIVRDRTGRIVFHAPVTSGSEFDPLPIGEWNVKDVLTNPVFNYNPDLFWDADPTHIKVRIKPGPNNPVGVVWIDLDKEHYGLHGTPEPQTVGRAQSHGCVRLTNWDAVRLAAHIARGTRVVFEP
jgi:lipoprotein-anchoring transpeptidase ErfK/SrfK